MVYLLSKNVAFARFLTPTKLSMSLYSSFNTTFDADRNLSTISLSLFLKVRIKDLSPTTFTEDCKESFVYLQVFWSLQSSDTFESSQLLSESHC